MLRQNRRRGSTPVSITVGLLLAGALVAGCRGTKAEDANAEAAPPPTTVGSENIVVIAQAELATGPSISGNLQAAQEATVRAQIGGTVLQTLVDEGSRVGNGTLLARMRPYMDGEKGPQLSNWYLNLWPGGGTLGARVVDPDDIGELERIVRDAEVTARSRHDEIVSEAMREAASIRSAAQEEVAGFLRRLDEERTRLLDSAREDAARILTDASTTSAAIANASPMGSPRRVSPLAVDSDSHAGTPLPSSSARTASTSARHGMVSTASTSACSPTVEASTSSRGRWNARSPATSRS